MFSIVIRAFLTIFISTATSYAGEKEYALSMHGDIKYSKDFKHFAYVNPDAPQGGSVTFGAIGTFNTLNPYTTKGIAPPGLHMLSDKLVFEPLMKRSSDEPFTLYGLIAESVEVGPERSWIVFHINPLAQWADGTPITAADIYFSWETLKEKGPPNTRLFYSRVEKVEILSPRSIRFTFPKDKETGKYDPEMPLLIGLMSVLPKHFFKDKEFEKTSLDPIMGSGPYEIHEMKPGQSITYKKRNNYWGKDLPVRRGFHNFDKIKFEYYRDTHVLRLAFAAGEFDFHAESSARKLKIKAVKEGKATFVQGTHSRPVGMKALAFNTRKEIFKDPEVRRALAYAFDFEWINKNLYNGAYKRTKSFFQNTELASSGRPSAEEHKLLNTFNVPLPKLLFEEEYTPPSTENNSIRENLRQAKDILLGAGWKIENKVLTHKKTREPFKFDILLFNKGDTKFVLPFVENLKTLGIQARIRLLDSAQFEQRRLDFDFDMIIQMWGHTLSPGAELEYYWSSDAADQKGSRNYPGIKNKAIDAACAALATASDRNELKTAIHVLDRLLLWGHYVIPLFYKNEFYLAYWNKLDHPQFDQETPILLSTWWVKENQ